MTYTEEFYDGATAEGLEASRIILPRLIAELDAKSVIDVGCARGAWLWYAKAEGCQVRGVDFYDGPKLIEPSEFVQADIRDGVNCAGFDLALCMEVAEHLPEWSANRLVSGLCKAKHVLFSAAVPGQPGVGHDNCHWQTWWADLFEKEGFVGSTLIRDRHWADRRIVYWYRQNLVLYSPKVTDITMPHEFR